MTKSNPIVITEVSTSIFSVARYSGGAVICGKTYKYFPHADMLIREDWVKYFQALSWDAFLSAVRDGKKPELPKKDKTKKVELTKSLFD